MTQSRINLRRIRLASMGSSILGSTLLLSLACSNAAGGDPPAISCPDGAAPELIRFTEHRLATEERELSAIGWRCFLPNGQRHGPSKEWYANGQVSAITEWSNGEKHGRFEMWYPDGQKKAEGEHAHWQAKGRWTTWKRDGTIQDQRDFGDPMSSALSTGAPSDDAAATAPSSAETQPRPAASETPEGSSAEPGA